MKKIKINYYDFGKNFNAENHYFTKLLRTKYDVEISNEPDYIFYTAGGNTHHTFDGIRIFWTGENIIPNFNYCDYALAFSHLSYLDRYMRLPLWALYKTQLEIALNPQTTLSDDAALNRSFCAVVIGNSLQTDGVRAQIFDALCQYKSVASGGKWRNTVGGPVPDKIAFQRNYKFSLAAENTKGDGYITEKILDSFASKTIPIYYGDASVVKDFNPKAFINANDFSTFDDLVAYVKQVDEDDELYLSIMREPVFQSGALDAVSDEKVLAFLSHIFDQPYEQARRRFYAKPYTDTDIYHLKQRDINDIFKAYLKRTLHLPHKKKG